MSKGGNKDSIKNEITRLEERLQALRGELLDDINELKKSSASVDTPMQIVGLGMANPDGISLIRYLVEQYSSMMNYSVTQGQAMVSMHKKMLQIDAFLKELVLILDLSEEDEIELQNLIEKYGLNVLFAQYAEGVKPYQ